MTAPDFSHAVWCKSSRSANGSACVEVAFVSGHIATRDSKNPRGGALVIPSGGWRAFLAAAKHGVFDVR